MLPLLRVAVAALPWLLCAPRAAALRVQKRSDSDPVLVASDGKAETFEATRRMLRPGVVHFMFELRDHIQHPAIWGKFFSQGLQGSYMAWAHCTDYQACQEDWMMKKIGIRLVPTVYSARGADLMNPFAHMIRLALAETGHLAERGVQEKFVVLSDATLPVKPFAHVHWDLLSRKESDICLANPKVWGKAVVDGVPLALPKHHQWVALNRVDAAKLAWEWTPVLYPRMWNITLRKGPWADKPRKVGRAAFGGVWYTATDEEAVYARVFGPLQLDTINDNKRMDELFDSRTCLTYVDFPDNVWPPSLLESHMDELVDKHYADPPPDLHIPFAQNPTEGPSLLQVGSGLGNVYNATLDITRKLLLEDKDSHFSVGSGTMHSLTIDRLGVKGLQAFRRSKYLFARKFSHCAHMPNYADIMFGE